MLLDDTLRKAISSLVLGVFGSQLNAERETGISQTRWSDWMGRTRPGSKRISEDNWNRVAALLEEHHLLPDNPIYWPPSRIAELQKLAKASHAAEIRETRAVYGDIIDTLEYIRINDTSRVEEVRKYAKYVKDQVMAARVPKRRRGRPPLQGKDE